MVYLALGSNLSDRFKALQNARRILAENMKIVAASPIYETGPRNILEQPKFLNAVLKVEGTPPPVELLNLLHGIEACLGRKQAERYGPRIIDIDIIYYRHEIIDTPTLTIPHPRRTERRFVLRPLSDIAPDMVDPLTHETVAEMLQNLEDPDDVVRTPQQW